MRYANFPADLKINFAEEMDEVFDLALAEKIGSKESRNR